MKEIIFYRTYSYGGMEGRTKEVRNFETVELAVEDALKDTWNEQFKLYKVKMIFDGKIIEEEKYIEPLVCGRDLISDNPLNKLNLESLTKPKRK